MLIKNPRCKTADHQIYGCLDDEQFCSTTNGYIPDSGVWTAEEREAAFTQGVTATIRETIRAYMTVSALILALEEEHDHECEANGGQCGFRCSDHAGLNHEFSGGRFPACALLAALKGEK